MGGGHAPRVRRWRDAALESVPRGRRAPGREHESAVFDPLLLAVNLHPTPLTWDLSIDRGLRARRCGRVRVRTRPRASASVPAVVTSAAFSLSGWFFLYSNNPFCRSYVFLPLLFLLVELVLRSTATVARPRARRRRRREPLRRNARSVVPGDRRHGRLCDRAPRPGAPADATPRSRSSASAAPACSA